MIGQVDHVLFVLWYISIYNNLQNEKVKDIVDSSKMIDIHNTHLFCLLFKKKKTPGICPTFTN